MRLSLAVNPAQWLQKRKYMYILWLHWWLSWFIVVSIIYNLNIIRSVQPMTFHACHYSAPLSFPVKKCQDCIPFHCPCPALCPQIGRRVGGWYFMSVQPRGDKANATESHYEWSRSSWWESCPLQWQYFWNSQGTSSGHWIAQWTLRQHKNTSCGQFRQRLSKLLYGDVGNRPQVTPSQHWMTC